MALRRAACKQPLATVRARPASRAAARGPIGSMGSGSHRAHGRAAGMVDYMYMAKETGIATLCHCLGECRCRHVNISTKAYAVPQVPHA